MLILVYDCVVRDGLGVKRLLFLLLGLGIGLLLALPVLADDGRTGERQRPAPVAVGDAAPDFELEGMGGQMVRLSQFRGRPVVINFWATWCPPCRAEMPLLQQTHDRYFAGGLVILAVNNAESRSTVQQFVESEQLTLPVLFDPQSTVSDLYQVRAYPTSVFIAADGTLKARQLGELSQDILSTHLRSIGVIP